MAREQNGVVGNFGEPLKALHHLLRVGAGEIGSSTPFEEQRVTGDESTVDEEALTPRRVTRRVQQRDVDLSNGEYVAGRVRDEVIVTDVGGFLNPFVFFGLNVNRAIDSVEQCCNALDVVSHH